MRPSEALQNEVADTLSHAVIKAANNWDFTDRLLAPFLRYIRACMAKTISDDYKGYYASTRPGGLSISFSVMDEDEPIIETGSIDLFDILRNQWPDCERSQADMIWALEHTVERLREDFKTQFGMPLDADAIGAKFKADYPNAVNSYEPWRPGSDE